MKKNFLLTALAFIFYLPIQFESTLCAQKIEDLLDSYIDANAKGYLQPLGELVSSNIHTGIREWSRVDSNFHVRIGLNAMLAFPNSKMKTFTGTTGLGFEPQQSVEVPTIIGENKAVAVEGVNGTYFIFPVGYNSRRLPFAVPQISLGGIYHTEITGRYFGFDLENDFGKVKFFGLGFRHGLNQYIKNFPLDLSIGYFYQKFDVGNYIHNRNHFISAHVGKSSNWWSSSLTFGYIHSSTDYNYTYIDESTTKSFQQSINGRFPVLVELNCAIKLWIISLYGAVSYSGPISTSLGLCFKL